MLAAFLADEAGILRRSRSRDPRTLRTSERHKFIAVISRRHAFS